MESLHSDICLDLKEFGFFDVTARELLHPSVCATIRTRCKTFIDERTQVNRPSTIRLNQMPTESALTDFHSKYGSGAYQISDDLWASGENAWRSEVSHCTFTDPLVNFPEILSVFQDGKLVSAISEYLGGDARLGYAKIKKSYANNLEFRSYNHLFHVDDNVESGTVKLLMYLDSVDSTLDGAFQYVIGSQNQKRDKVYFDLSEISAESIHTLTGPAGTACLMDANGIHRENHALTTDRWVLICNFVIERELYGKPLKVMREDVNDYEISESFFEYCNLI